jgi:CheY-like chemotaxis protein
MRKRGKPITVLMAEDDPDDRLLAMEAWEASRLDSLLHFVEDGEELIDYLYQQGRYAASGSAPRPDLILLDLNMPRKDGREALREIKADPRLRCTPVVVLTTSKAEEDTLRSYDLGASGFIIKPVTFEGLVETVKAIGRYWFQIVELPARADRDLPRS